MVVKVRNVSLDPVEEVNLRFMKIQIFSFQIKRFRTVAPVAHALKLT